MATTNILNHYRNLVVSDKNLFLLLSIIYKEGDVSEETLYEKIDMQPSELRLTLNKLFRSNLAKIGSVSHYWNCTSLGEELLSTLGITELSSISYITEQDIPENDKELLTTLLRVRSKQNNQWSKSVNSQLKVLSKVFNLVSDKELINQQLRTRTIKAIVLGSDIAASELQSDVYCNLIYPEISEKIRPTSSKVRISKNYYFSACKSALDDYKASNRFFVATESVSNPAVLFLSYSRLLVNAKEESDVCGVLHFHRLNSNFHVSALRKINLEIPELEKSMMRAVFISYSDKNKTESLESLRQTLISKLNKTFTENVSGFQNVFKTHAYLHSQTGLKNELGFDHYRDAIDELIEGKFESFSIEEKHLLYLKTHRLLSYMNDLVIKK